MDGEDDKTICYDNNSLQDPTNENDEAMRRRVRLQTRERRTKLKSIKNDKQLFFYCEFYGFLISYFI